MALLLFVALFTFCKSPFSTRDPEPPVNQKSSWIQPTQPNYVVINLKNAISEKNVSNYNRCFSDSVNTGKSFRFYASTAVANAYPNLFAVWTKASESIYFNQLMLYLPQDSTSSLSLSLPVKENTFQDSVIILYDYQLLLNHTVPVSECPKEMQGQSEFVISKSADDLWYIRRWIDFAVSDDPTWSQIKAYFGK